LPEIGEREARAGQFARHGDDPEPSNQRAICDALAMLMDLDHELQKRKSDEKRKQSNGPAAHAWIG
jgi:hypothetical protein